MAGAHGVSARELPLGPTPRSRRTRKGQGPIAGSDIRHVPTTPANRGQKQRSPKQISPVSIPLRTVWKPNRIGWLLIGWGSWSQRAPRVARQDNVEVPPHMGRIGSHPRMKNPSISLRLQQPAGGNGDPPGRCRHAVCGNLNLTSWLLSRGSSVRGELPLWPTSRSHSTRGGEGLNPEKTKSIHGRL